MGSIGATAVVAFQGWGVGESVGWDSGVMCREGLASAGFDADRGVSAVPGVGHDAWDAADHADWRESTGALLDGLPESLAECDDWFNLRLASYRVSGLAGCNPAGMAG